MKMTCLEHFEIESVLSCRDNSQGCVYLYGSKSHATAPQPDILSFCLNDFMLGEAESRVNISGRKGQYVTLGAGAPSKYRQTDMLCLCFSGLLYFVFSGLLN